MVATIVSVVAIVVSALVAVYTKWATDRQAERSDGIQERIARVEEGRRLDELRPRFDLKWRAQEAAATAVLRGPADYTMVHVCLVVDAPLPPYVLGLEVPDGETWLDLGSLVQGGERSIPFRVNQNRDGGEIRLRFRCVLADGTSTEAVEPLKVNRPGRVISIR